MLFIIRRTHQIFNFAIAEFSRLRRDQANYQTIQFSIERVLLAFTQTSWDSYAFTFLLKSPQFIFAFKMSDKEVQETPIETTEATEKVEAPATETPASEEAPAKESPDTANEELKRKNEGEPKKEKKRRRRQYDDAPEEEEEEEDDDDEDDDKLDAKLEEDDDADEDDLAEIDSSNIITTGRRTRGKVIDYAKTAEKLDEEGKANDDEEDDGEFKAND